MNTYIKKIVVDKETLDFINKALTFEPKSKEEMVLTEDDRNIVHTATFPNGYFMDIKCCGVQYEEDSCNTAWTEAVLFDKKGYEVDCSDVEEKYLRTWELEDEDGNSYRCEVVSA